MAGYFKTGREVVMGRKSREKQRRKFGDSSTRVTPTAALPKSLQLLVQEKIGSTTERGALIARRFPGGTSVEFVPEANLSNELDCEPRYEIHLLELVRNYNHATEIPLVFVDDLGYGTAYLCRRR